MKTVLGATKKTGEREKVKGESEDEKLLVFQAVPKTGMRLGGIWLFTFPFDLSPLTFPRGAQFSLAASFCSSMIRLRIS
jgi:hypothetical protein